MGHLARGVRLVAVQEFRMRLRTGRWRWLLGAWVLVLTLFTVLLDWALVASGTQGAVGVPMFGVLMLFVLGLVLVVSPVLTAQSVNGDRERGTLATLQTTRLTAAQIALGKLLAGWAVGLIALALTLPFVGWAMVNGGLTAQRVAAVLAIAALLMGVVCAISQALSSLLARSITSALLSYLTVFALTAGTVIAFGLAAPLVAERAGVGDYEHTVNRTDRVWWLLAPNPFVILADSAPHLPPRVVVMDQGQRVRVEPDDPLSGLGSAVRRVRLPPDGRGGEVTSAPPVWPYGLGFDLLLAAGAVAVTVRRLRAPSGKLPTGVRVG